MISRHQTSEMPRVGTRGTLRANCQAKLQLPGLTSSSICRLRPQRYNGCDTGYENSQNCSSGYASKRSSCEAYLPPCWPSVESGFARRCRARAVKCSSARYGPQSVPYLNIEAITVLSFSTNSRVTVRLWYLGGHVENSDRMHYYAVLPPIVHSENQGD